MRIMTALGLLALCCLWAPNADASCGLDQCPSDWSGEADSTWSMTSMTRYTRVTDGFYVEEFVGGRRLLTSAFRAGLAAPLVYVDQAGSSHSGLGNLVGVFEYMPLGQLVRGYALGLQAEFPTATQPQLGDGHMVALPYARGWFRSGLWNLRGQFGWGYTLDGGGHHHHHDHGHANSSAQPATVSWVNPHSDSELLARASLGMVLHTTMILQAGFDGVLELGSGDQIFAGTLGFEYQGHRLTLGLVGEVPVTELRRSQGRARLTLGWRL